MGKRVVVTGEHHHVTPQTTRTIRKRNRNSAHSGASATKNLRLSSTPAANVWHENDYGDSSSSSNDAVPSCNQSSKQANNSSILLNSPVCSHTGGGEAANITESPKPVYTLRPSLVNGTILYDLTEKPWRLGKPIGKGNFGEIFLASDNITVPVTNENSKFVVKIEPHSNGPLFVEIHCLMNTAKSISSDNGTNKEDHKLLGARPAPSLSQKPPSGIPDYIASGSHHFGNARYRFLVLPRFDRDLHSVIKNCRMHQKSVLTLAVHIVNALENLHDKGYCHNDVKAQNLMISKCQYYKQNIGYAKRNGAIGKSSTVTLHKKRYDDHYEEKQPTTDSGNSSEQEGNDEFEELDDEDFLAKRKTYANDDDEDEDFDDGATTNSNNSNSVDTYSTPINRNRGRRALQVEFSGSNPVRSCRRQKRNSIYEEMVKSHYLRPAKRVSYSEFFNEDGVSVKGDEHDVNTSSADESEEFVPCSMRRSARKTCSAASVAKTCQAKRLTRRQEKLLARTSAMQQQPHKTVSSAVGSQMVVVEEERIFLIDYGLASKFMDNGVHRPFVMDQRRAHDGTLEFTSRDAHMGAHSRRSDLECLGYNMLFWSQGYLPWKDAASQHQQEKVHRAKEYLMTDVRELLKQIYGKQVPKYLGEFLHQVGQLAYHERPNYARYRRIFEREFQQLGYALSEMHLDSHEIARSCVRVKSAIENKNDIFDLQKPHTNAWSIISNLSVCTPFQDRTISNRVSPKNLRSKSDKKSLKKSKFSWAEVLSQDPDQIARERAEKEFDREEESSDVQQPTVRRYEGKPTYAILELQQHLKISGRLMEKEKNDDNEDDDNDDDDGREQEEGNENTEDYEEEDIEDAQDQEEEEINGELIEISDEENEVDTDDDQHDNENNQEEEDAEVETDATEISDQYRTCNGRTRHKCSFNLTTTTITTKNSKRQRTSNGRFKRRRLNEKRSYPAATNEITTRARSTTVTTKMTSNNSQSNMKRGTVTRHGRNSKANRVGLHASATGEIEQQHAALRYLDSNRQQQQQRHGNGVLYERRTRRCLIKTDAEQLKAAEGEESNSNFSPDVRSLFNVWSKINNESIYYRGSNAAAVRHCKK